MIDGARRVAIGAAALLVALSGCERAQDEAAANVVERILAEHGREAEVAIDRREGSITVRLGGPTIPEGWPPDVPVHPEAERVRVSVAGKARTVLSLQAGSAPDDVADWYRKELASAGWRVEPPGDRGRVIAHREERRLVAAFARGGQGRIEIVATEIGG